MKRMSNTKLYLLCICLFLVGVNISLGYVLTRQSSTAMRTLIGNRMLDISNTAAAMLDGDALEEIQAEDVNTPAYQAALKTLSYYQDNIDLSYIYCIRALDDGTFIFTIDPSEDPGEFGEEITRTDALCQASLGTAAVDREPYTDRCGRFYSAYTPVFNARHQVSAIVAVDFTAEWYEDQVNLHVRTVLLMCVASLAIAGAIIALVTAQYREQFHQMLAAMNGVSDGIETLLHELSPAMELVVGQESSEVHSSDDFTELGHQIQSLERKLGNQISLVRSRAYVDALTGLGNRTAYEDQVKLLDDQINDGTAAFSVAVFDLNGLKEINDRQGHEQGDRAISALAQTLQEAFPNDRLFRIGGDEFIVLSVGRGNSLPRRILAVDTLLGRRTTATSAKGWATYDPDTDLAFREVFKRADNAMYDDKKRYYLSHRSGRRKRDGQ